jgi:GNAT superfamily N-acetyltransferase
VPLPPVRVGTESDLTSAINTLVLAFAADAPTRWMWPDPQTYLESMPRLLKAVAGKVFEIGSAHVIEESRGVALWVPPGVDVADPAVVDVIKETVPRAKQEQLRANAEEQASFAIEEPHWILPFIGVDVVLQGQGLGSALLKVGVERCDRDGRCATLGASSSTNIRLYQRYGFEVVGETMLGGEIPIASMVRNPQ